MGVIPEDWEAKNFEDVMDGFTSGQTPYRAKPEYYKGNIPWITSGELDYNIITDTIERITPRAVLDTNLKIIPKGTFLFAITGLEAEGTRGSCAITGIEATTNQSCMALYPKRGMLTTDYLFHYYAEFGKRLALVYCQGTKQQSYTGATAKLLPIILPPTIREQSVIAEVLSDTEELIQTLDKLIGKKRNLKQGAVQELLTGKRRLPGFRGKWETKALGELGKFKNGINKGKEEFGHGFPFVNLMDVFGIPTIYNDVGFGLVNSTEAERRLFDLNKGDVLFVRSSVKPEGVGLTTLVCENLSNTVFSGFLIRFRDDGQLAFEFKQHCFGLPRFRNRLIASSTVSANTNINQDALKSLQLTFPSDKEEQTAIASVISDMDAEIEELEKMRDKYLMIKKGMMQQLLTGRIRLR